MPELTHHITGLVDTGVFYFKDSPHYHYARKNADLLEDLKTYKFVLPSNVKSLTNPKISKSVIEEEDLPLGYGTAYGYEYGGLFLTDNNSSLTLKLFDSDENPIPTIDGTTNLKFDSLNYVNNPVRNFITHDNVNNRIEISYTDLYNKPNCFGVNALEKDEVRKNIIVRSGGLAAGAGYIKIDLDTNIAVPRSYRLVIIDVSTGSTILSKSYDIHGSTDDADDFVDDITAADKTNLFIISTSDEPYTNAVNRQSVRDALVSLKATVTNIDRIESRGAYILASIPSSDIAIEKVQPAGTGNTANAVVNLKFILSNKKIIEEFNDSYSTVEIYQQSALNSDGTFVDYDVHKYNGGTDTTQVFSIETTRNTLPCSLATITSAYTNDNPIFIQTTSYELLEYLRLTDVIWVEFYVEMVKVNLSSDVPESSNVKVGQVFEITNSLDANYGKYFVLNSSNVLVMKSSIPRRKTSTIQMKVVEVPLVPGSIRQSNGFYATPVNGFDQANYFSTTNVENELPQALFTFFDGIPARSKIYTNRSTAHVHSYMHNYLLLRSGSNNVPDTTTKVAYEFPADQKQRLYLEGLKSNSNPKVKLLGRGVDVEYGNRIFFWESEVKYRLPVGYVHGTAPLVITDLLATDIDEKETTNVEFMIDGTELTFNRCNNRLSNPTFLKGSDAWKLTNASIIQDEDKNFSLLHERSVKLTGKGACISQHVPGIDFTKNYCLSLFSKSTNSTIKATIYCFNNNGKNLSNVPDIFISTEVNIEDNSWYDSLNTYEYLGNNRYIEQNTLFNFVKTIQYSELDVPESFTKMVARVYSIHDFNKSDHLEFEPPTANNFTSQVTDIVIEIENTLAGSIVYLDALQFEIGSNPSEFSSLYDIAVVEYETSDKTYAARYILGSSDNRLNKGYLTINIDKVKDELAFTPYELLSYSNRSKVRNVINQNHWAKLYGKDKYVNVAKFSKYRSEHLGEFFLYASTPKASKITFIPEPLTVQQSGMISGGISSNLYVLVEDENAVNLPGQEVRVEYGFTRDSMINLATYTTEDDGTVAFNIPELFSETVSPLVRFTKNRDYYLLADYVAGQHEYYCMFDKEGSQSAVFNHLGLAITSGSTASMPFILPIAKNSNVPLEYFEWPLELPFDVDLLNNGSMCATYMSGINNVEKSINMYNRTDFNEVTLPVTTVGSLKVINLNLVTVNPIEGSISLVNPTNPMVTYKEVLYPSSIRNTFYFDRANSRIVVNDANSTSLTIKYLKHFVYILPENQRKIYIHRQIFSKAIKEVYETIDSSSLKYQHSIGLPAEMSTVDEMECLDFPLYFRLSYNVSLYLNAQSWTSKAQSKVVYTHSKALL